MATSMTGSFYLTETVTLPAATVGGTRVQGEIDIGAYVNVPTGQCVAVEFVDFVFQASSIFSNSPDQMLNANGSISVQLSDLNPGTAMIRADDQSLIASGGLIADIGNNIASHETDLYPDNFGPASNSESFMVVNDTMYLVAGPNSADIAGSAVHVTARIRCRVVKLSQQDWMAIAIQSTASDN